MQDTPIVMLFHRDSALYIGLDEECLTFFFQSKLCFRALVFARRSLAGFRVCAIRRGLKWDAQMPVFQACAVENFCISFFSLTLFACTECTESAVSYPVHDGATDCHVTL